MNKKSAFTIFFTIFSVGIFLFTVNEYLKRVEKKAIETYLNSIQNEFSEYSLNITIDPVTCKGIIRHKCNIENIKISDKDTEITLKNNSAKITNISHNSIGVEFSIDDISHNSYTNPYLALLPMKFTYKLNLQKQDSKLGYVLLNRSIYLDFNDFDMNINLDILLREKIFRNKSILFLLKEWFDSTTPSFYEYSLDTLMINLSSKKQKTLHSTYLDKRSTTLKLLIDKSKAIYQKDKALFNNNLITDYFNRFVKNSYELLDNKINTIELDIKRKNQDLVFFNLLSNEASIKKVLEIMQIIDSINETYEINLSTN